MLKIDNLKVVLALSNASYTVKELAKQSGLSTGSISKIINGHTLKVRPATIGKLAKALDVDVKDLL